MGAVQMQFSDSHDESLHVSKKRILIVSSIDISLLRFRGQLIRKLIEADFDVLVAAPSYNKETENKLQELGAQTFSFSLSRSGLAVWEDWATYSQLYELMRREKIDIVFPYTIKPVMYASLAAKRLGIPSVGLVNGLGYMFSGNSLKQKALRSLIIPIYRRCVSANRAMIFQNEDDAEYFREKSLLAVGTQITVVSGSGVDLNEFKYREPRGVASLRFAFVARLLEEKGIGLFLESAKELKEKWPDAEFHIFGESQPGSPNAISVAVLNEMADQGIVHFHGRRPDIVEQLTKMDVIVCPSWYREGIPRALLEGLSVGLAVIATDSPGCREAVLDGVNGWLIPPKDQTALTRAIQNALEDSEKIRSMSIESRKYAVERFDVQLVNLELLSVFEDVMHGDDEGVRNACAKK